jgi:hypothetical protein
MKIGNVANSVPISGPAPTQKDTESAQPSELQQPQNQQTNVSNAFERAFSNFDHVIAAVQGSGTSMGASPIQNAQSGDTVDSTTLQQMMDNSDKTQQTLSNILKKSHDASNSITGTGKP